MTTLGVLAGIQSNPEVKAVFPLLSSSVIRHQQKIQIWRGDTLDLHVQVQDDCDPPNQVDIRQAIVRFAVKQGFGLDNASALILKESQDPFQVAITDATRGQAIIRIKRDDTLGLPIGIAAWDIEITRAGDPIELPEGSVVTTTAGSDVLFACPGPGLDWTALDLSAGDLIEIDCVLYMVKNVLNNVQLQLEEKLASNATAVSVSAFRGNVKTAAFGTFEVQGDVTL